ncbi:transglutaminase family protein [Sphingomonas sp.]|uniref:transglutaminase family protein n=1 Tax=Sphingomonas sp. TaxID=28214 RepID=UPI001D238EB1|nr:transglutaminase family protein [Sphingomonas sp.]MBX9797142.1 transglutaminase family protein [Sphingomonas sp.]
MRLRLDHLTRYSYANPAADIVQALRVTPSAHDGQHIIRWRVDIDADGTLRESVDAFGNQVTMFYASTTVETIAIRVTGEADIEDRAGVVRAREPLPAAVFLRATPLTEPSPDIAALAARFADAPALDALHALCATLYHEMRFEPGLTDAATPAAVALAAGHGVCQDFAHIFIAAARQLGVPARYVSGHLARDAQQEAAHAWAEAHVPGLGWVAFDPANGICTTDHYLRVAIGLDYLTAAPLRGARRGGGAESLTVTVDAAASARQQ